VSKKNFNQLLRSRSNRFLFIAFCGFITTSSAYSYLTVRNQKPTDWYYYTVEDGRTLDGHFRSINRDTLPTVFMEENTTYALFQNRCSIEILEKIHDTPVWLTYREVSLCNTAALKPDNFAMATTTFEKEVDDRFFKYFSDLVFSYASNLGIALVAWICLVACLQIWIWIAKGDSNKSQNNFR